MMKAKTSTSGKPVIWVQVYIYILNPLFSKHVFRGNCSAPCQVFGASLSLSFISKVYFMSCWFILKARQFSSGLKQSSLTFYRDKCATCTVADAPLEVGIAIYKDRGVSFGFAVNTLQHTPISNNAENPRLSHLTKLPCNWN